jgi:hypothetical protein
MSCSTHVLFGRFSNNNVTDAPLLSLKKQTPSAGAQGVGVCCLTRLFSAEQPMHVGGRGR